MLVPRNIRLFLPTFAEYAFLRAVDSHGCLLGTRKTNLVDAVQRTFGGREALAHTSIILIYRPTHGHPMESQEFVMSTRYKPWGYNLPSCPSCGNGAVNAPIRFGVATVTCLSCRRCTDGPGVTVPDGVIPVKNHKDPEDLGDRYYWRPLNAVSPWLNHKWKSD